MAAEKALPAQAHRERFGAEKVFVAEAGVVAKGDGLSFESGAAPQGEIVAAYFDRSSEDRLQARGESFLQASMADQERYPEVQNPQKDDEVENVLGPASPAAGARGGIYGFGVKSWLGESL